MQKLFPRVLLCAALAAFLAACSAGTAPKVKPAAVSITFDDGKPSVFTNAFPVLAVRDYPATMYVITGELGIADWHITWNQARMMQKHGWELGSHTVNHPDLTKLAPLEALGELEQSRNTLSELGFPSDSFASPYGEMNPEVLQMVRTLYRSHRQAWGVNDGLNPIRGFDPYAITALEVTKESDVALVGQVLDRAIAENKWLVLLFHQVVEGQVEENTQVSAKLFLDVIEQIDQRAEHLEVRTVGDMVVTNGLK